MNRSRTKIAVAMSGGVDSAVAAWLLLQQQQQHAIIGLHMTNWDVRDEDCNITSECMEREVRNAQAVCKHLNMSLVQTNFSAEYWNQVFVPYVDGISKGTIPNPDVGCNVHVKFGAMKDYAFRTLGAKYIATGHYARLWHRTSTTPTNALSPALQQTLDSHDWLHSWGNSIEDPLLLAGVDSTKDQSYFLATVSGAKLRNVLFPLGDLMKNNNGNNADNNNTMTAPTTTTTVRDLALQAHLPNASKKDSMGICFVGKRKFENFISQYLPHLPPSGTFVDIDTGAIVGTHSGALYYSIGQGAKIGGKPHRYFVVDKELDNDNISATPEHGNIVWVCQGTDHPALLAKSMTVEHFVWNGGEIPEPLKRTGRLRATCRGGHLQPLVDCEISMPMNQGEANNVFEVHLSEPVRALTPGQIAAIHLGDICLGGGPIRSVERSYNWRLSSFNTTNAQTKATA